LTSILADELSRRVKYPAELDQIDHPEHAKLGMRQDTMRRLLRDHIDAVQQSWALMGSAELSHAGVKK